QTVAYCQEHGIEPIEDLSNSDLRFLRNRIRHELVPLLESLNPGFDNTLLRNAGVIGVDVEWVEAQIDSCWSTVVSSEQEDKITLRREALSSLPLSLQRHLLRRVTAHLCDGQSPLEIRHYLLIEQLMGHKDRQERTLDLPHELHMVCGFHEIAFERLPAHVSIRDIITGDQQNEEVVLLPIPGRIKVQGTPWIATAEPAPARLMAEVRDALRLEDWSEVWRLLPATQQVVYVDADVAGSFLEVRTRKKGDRMRPLGMQHEKKMQDIFVDQHVARSDRGTTPIFFSTSHCIWLAGVCLDDRARLTSKTQQIVRLAIIKETMRWHQLE
ncbi:MAG: tRNA lysidine(34) synthetase TilS, partial [Ktedonobacteraceae bacterium]